MDVHDLPASLIDAAAEITINSSIFSDDLETHLAAAVEFSPTQRNTHLRIDRFFFLFYPLEPIRIKAGRYIYRPGSAELFSATNFFSGFDIESLIYQDEQGLFPPHNLLQASLFLGSFYGHATVSPFLPEWPIPDSSSPWFFSGSFPESISISFPSKQTLTRNGIEIIAVENEPSFLSSVSVMAEAGLTLSGVDLSLMYFRGWDPEFSAEVSPSFPTGLFGGYLVKLTPVRNIIHVAGLNLASSLGAFRFWLDASYSFNKLLPTDRISVTRLSSSLAPAGYFRYTPGVSYQFSEIDVVATIEYKGDAIFSKDYPGLQRPFFSRLFAGVLRGSFLSSKLQAIMAALVSVKDGSFSVLPKLVYRPSDSLSLAVHSPFFFGSHETEFGQYSDNHLLAIKLTGYF